MDFYAGDDQVAQLDKPVQTPSPDRLTALAWHLRQRDSRRALALANEAEASAGGTLPPALQARLGLVRAEVAALNAAFDQAAAHASQARQRFEALGDIVGVGDSYLAEVLLGHVQGDSQTALTKADAAYKAFGLADDLERARIAAAWAAIASVPVKPGATATWLDLAAGDNHATQALDVLCGMVAGLQFFDRGDQTRAAAQFGGLTSPAEAAGLIYLRIRIGIAVAAACANVADRDNALAWSEQTVAIARRSGWPLPTADALSLLGNLCREAGQLSRSLELLHEAVSHAAVAPQSRGNALVHTYLAHTELAGGRYESVQAEAAIAESVASALNAYPIMADALTLRARALARLGRFDEAEAACETARQLADDHQLPVWQMDAWRALADVHAEHGGSGLQRAIGCLEMALHIAQSTTCEPEHIQILEALSSQHEQAGQLALALQYERQARAVQLANETRHQGERLAMLELRHRNEMDALVKQHDQALAALAQERAREYEASRQVLENLGRIGREITANLDIANVLHTLVAHLGKLVEVSFVGISVLESNGKLMVRRGVEDGRPMPERRLSIDDPNSKAAQCARERREILVEIRPGQRLAAHLPGTREMYASWFGPLIVGEELVGVLTIQSAIEQAYGEREHLIFRTLSAYVAVAVANARVYTRLGEQHARLTGVEAEMRRLATTDALTGIPNRRQFMSALGQEARRSARNGKPLTVIMGDIDYFKRVNDTLGHAAGDQVLIRIADVLQSAKRGADMVGRLGGEEFAVLLPETSAEQAVEVAERLLGLIAAQPIAWESNSVPVTMSFGCAALTHIAAGASESSLIESLLQAADRALYEAKHAGRNRVAWIEEGEARTGLPSHPAD